MAACAQTYVQAKSFHDKISRFLVMIRFVVMLFISHSITWLHPRMYLSFKTKPSKGSLTKRRPSKRFVPFGRVREGRVTSTVVGFTNCHALELLHHEQNRILTVRENARIQVRFGLVG